MCCSPPSLPSPKPGVSAAHPDGSRAACFSEAEEQAGRTRVCPFVSQAPPCWGFMQRRPFSLVGALGEKAQPSLGVFCVQGHASWYLLSVAFRGAQRRCPPPAPNLPQTFQCLRPLAPRAFGLYNAASFFRLELR